MSQFIQWILSRFRALIDLLRRFLPRRCPISWRPSALAPVFYGYRDYTSMDGAPGSLRVFFPSLDGSPQTAPILADCGLYPLIVFAHGHCPGEAEHFQKWFELPAQLARAGYVVAVPQLPQISSGISPSQADNDLVLLKDLISWMRTLWAHRTVLAPAPSTGLAGHSFGGGLAGRLAAEGSVAAFASLSGVVSRQFQENITAPKLFIWGTGENAFTVGVELTDAEWHALSTPKHRMVVRDMTHWDYLPAGRSQCQRERGPCEAATVVSWDVLAMFFGEYLPPPAALGIPGQIPTSLVPPIPLNLTDDQQFFGGGWLSGFELLGAGSMSCEVALSWDTGSGLETVTKP